MPNQMMNTGSSASAGIIRSACTGAFTRSSASRNNPAATPRTSPIPIPSANPVPTRRADAARCRHSSPELIRSQPAATTSVGAGVVAPSQPRAPSCHRISTSTNPADLRARPVARRHAADSGAVVAGVGTGTAVGGGAVATGSSWSVIGQRS
ncbi:Uncharacterised protein [Mycobacteroides abscessus subsp. abscessus]|nr:Uncharacterised protein [Mycobacteroides abscessus subsp. abscessus]